MKANLRLYKDITHKVYTRVSSRTILSQEVPGGSQDGTGQDIPNGCLDGYEVKVNMGIFKYQEKVKLISQFQRFSSFFNGLLEFASLP